MRGAVNKFAYIYIYIYICADFKSLKETKKHCIGYTFGIWITWRNASDGKGEHMFLHVAENLVFTRAQSVDAGVVKK